MLTAPRIEQRRVVRAAVLIAPIRKSVSICEICG